MLPEHKLLSHNNGQLSYRDVGEGPALLFLHGLNGNSKSWKRQFEEIAGQFRLIAWDAPGYGSSSLLTEAGIDAYSDIAADLVESLGIPQYSVVGHSMGGVVAGRLAARHPKTVRRLVLSCTHSGNGLPVSENLGKSYITRIENRNKLSNSEFGRFGAGRMLPDTVAPNIFDEVAEIASEVRSDGLEAAIKVINYADNRPHLAELNCPVLIVDAELDPVVPSERTEDLRRVIRQAKNATLKGVGHAPYLEDSKAFNKMITEFMTS